MVAQNILESVFALPLVDQLELFERLRDRLRGEVPVSDEHRQLLDERMDEYAADPTEGLPWAEVDAQIRAKLVQS